MEIEAPEVEVTVEQEPQVISMSLSILAFNNNKNHMLMLEVLELIPADDPINNMILSTTLIVIK
jgi:hypothetical protein